MGQANNPCKTLTKAPKQALEVKPMGSEPLPDALISDISHMLHKERVREMSRKILSPTMVEDPAWIVHEEETPAPAPPRKQRQAQGAAEAATATPVPMNWVNELVEELANENGGDASSFAGAAGATQNRNV
jgi:hypothetical protein